jgi:dihydrofolate reductase
MTNVIFDISMSLDGFITASNQTPEEPLGDGGERLHEWAFSAADDRSREVLTRAVETAGAVIAGRRTYDTSLPGWGADGPTGAARLPLFVVTHSQPQDVPAGGVYRFVTDGIHSALQQAKAAAGDKNVVVMGGADIGQQFLRAGLLDEIQIHLVPVLFGSGTRMFEQLDNGHVHLEVAELIGASEATHLRYRLVKPSS